MGLIDLTALLITLAAILSYINVRFLRLPTTIGLMVMAMLLSLGLIGLGTVWPWFAHEAALLRDSIDFNETLMHGMLGLLLFAGALHVNLRDLKQQRLAIAGLASLGVIVSTFLIGAMAWLIFALIGLEVRWIHCLLFGALISPTDPIAVLGILKRLGAPKSLETKITGESLFNDGVGVVVFLAIAGIAGLSAGHGEHDGHNRADHASVQAVAIAEVQLQQSMDADASHNAKEAHDNDVDAGDVAFLFIKEAVGGAVFGLVIGLIAYLMLKSVENYSVEVLISLALALGGYALAYNLHISGPIAMVVAGLLIGNHGRTLAMSPTTREHLDTFWELVDEILNAVLFVLIGVEVLVLTFEGRYLLAGLLAVPATLLGRVVAVSLPLTMLRRFRRLTPHAVKVLTWGGLRGGISVALALSLQGTLGQQHPDAYQAILFITYVVVVFSIVIQGLTLGPLLARLGLVQPIEAQPPMNAHEHE